MATGEKEYSSRRGRLSALKLQTFFSQVVQISGHLDKGERAMKRKKANRSSGTKTGQGQGSVATVLEKAAEVSSSLPVHPVQAWQSAKEGTQELASALPEIKGMGQVKEFIRRYPGVSTCTALVVGYMVFGSTLPFLGRVVRLIRS
jgi:hypothetical protein